MSFSLLLQTHSSTVEITSLTNVYIALGGTLFAALLSAYASLVASSRATRVSQTVTNTSQEIAALSAQVARESAALAAKTAHEIKDIDYKQVFYKMIMERRLKAWEDAEELFTELEPSIEYADEKGKESFRYFSSGVAFDEVYDKMRSLAINQQLWMDREYFDLYLKYYNKLVAIRKESIGARNNTGRTIIDDGLLKIAGFKYFDELSPILTSLLSLLSNKLADLHDVEGFVSRYRS